MSSYDSGSGAAATPSATSIPSVCPACQSSSITTTAKIPDVSSYWRCGNCGEVWNVSRRHAARIGANRWR